MKLFSTLLPLLYATLVTSNSLGLGASFNFGSEQQQQHPLPQEGDGPLSVPGKNPLRFCADPTPYLLTITSVDLDPNPPSPGANLSITASGTLSKTINPGAKVFLQVKYGLITLIKQEADLCEQIGAVNLTCPLEKGDISITKSVQLPKQIPKGKYTVMADVYNEEKETVTCMESVVFFT